MSDPTDDFIDALRSSTALRNGGPPLDEIDAAIDALFPGMVLVPRESAFRILGIKKSLGHELIDAGVLVRIKIGNASRITLSSIKRAAHGLIGRGARGGWNKPAGPDAGIEPAPLPADAPAKRPRGRPRLRPIPGGLGGRDAPTAKRRVLADPVVDAKARLADAETEAAKLAETEAADRDVPPTQKRVERPQGAGKPAARLTRPSDAKLPITRPALADA